LVIIHKSYCVLVVVDIRVSADAVLEADVQAIPEEAVQHQISHHPNPVFNLQENQETPRVRVGQCRVRAGQSGLEPGQSGSVPGQSGLEPGQSGSEPGQSGSEPGQSGSEPGQSRSQWVSAGSVPGQSPVRVGQSRVRAGQSGSERFSAGSEWVRAGSEWVRAGSEREAAHGTLRPTGNTQVSLNVPLVMFLNHGEDPPSLPSSSASCWREEMEDLLQLRLLLEGRDGGSSPAPPPAGGKRWSSGSNNMSLSERVGELRWPAVGRSISRVALLRAALINTSFFVEAK